MTDEQRRSRLADLMAWVCSPAVRQRWSGGVAWLLAGGAALAAGWTVQHYLDGKERELVDRNTVVLIPRLVAAADLAAGQVLTEADLALRDLPAAWASSRGLGAEQADLLLGLRLRVAVTAGDPLLLDDVQAEAPAIAARLAPGMRALTLSLRELSEAPPALQAGDRVDLYLSLQRQGRLLTLPLLQNGMVVAPPDSERAQLVLQASAQDALRVIAARQMGALTLTLRAEQEGASAGPAQAVDAADVLGLQVPVIEEVPVLYGDAAQEGTDKEEP